MVCIFSLLGAAFDEGASQTFKEDQQVEGRKMPIHLKKIPSFFKHCERYTVLYDDSRRDLI